MLNLNQVTHISSSESGYTLTYSTTDTPELSEHFDAVVLATPLHDADITFSEDLQSSVSAQVKPFQRTIATFVNGALAPLIPGEVNTDDVLTVNSKEAKEIGFSSIGSKGNSNYKVFSNEPLTVTQMAKMFSIINEVKVVDWMAYPKYSVPDTLPDFELAPGLYYINAIESAASAIEMSCIGSKNVALLVHQYLNKMEAVEQGGVCKDAKRYREEL